MKEEKDRRRRREGEEKDRRRRREGEEKENLSNNTLFAMMILDCLKFWSKGKLFNMELPYQFLALNDSPRSVYNFQQKRT